MKEYFLSNFWLHTPMQEFVQGQRWRDAIAISAATIVFGSFWLWMLFLAYVSYQPNFFLTFAPPLFSFKAMVVWSLVLALPRSIRPVVFLWPALLILMVMLPIAYQKWRQIIGNHYRVRINDEGVTGFTFDGPQHFKWTELTHIDALRPLRLATDKRPAVVLSAKPASSTDLKIQSNCSRISRFIEKFCWAFFIVISFAWIRGRPLFPAPCERRMRLQPPDMALTMQFIRKRRPDLVARIPLSSS